MSNNNWGQPASTITYQSSNAYSSTSYSTASISVTTTTTTLLSSVFTSSGIPSVSTGASSGAGGAHGSTTASGASTIGAGLSPTSAPNNAPPANALQYCNNPRNYTFFDPLFNPTVCPGFCPTDRMLIDLIVLVPDQT